MADFYDAAASYRDSILDKCERLAGEGSSDGETWTCTARRLARELRRYADLLESSLDGHVDGPIVFPSWSELYEDHSPR